MSKLQKILMFVGVVAFTFMYGNRVVNAAPGPFSCSSNFYQVISGQLELLNPLTGVYTDIGSNAGFDYNAIGYNVLDNYIYGIETGTPQAGDLLRIANDGSVTDLGLPIGLPAASYNNGSFDQAGNLYVRSTDHNIYEINVSTMTTTTLTISGDPIVSGNDSVFIDNNLYFLSGDTLSVVNLSADSASTETVSGPSSWLTAGPDFGAAWSDQAGELFFSNNESGSIYQISDYNSPTPTATFQVMGMVTANNDGASCPTALQSPFDPPVANNYTYTTLFNAPLNETSSLLSNDLGNSLTITSNTNPAHGTVAVNPDGTFLYTPDSGFSGTDSFDYTVTDSFGRTSSATVTITVLPTSVAKVPSTGFGAPNHSGHLVVGLTAAALGSFSSGLWLLYRQKRAGAHYYLYR